MTLTVDRREFLKTSAAAGAGLVIGFYLPSKSKAAPASFQPNAWLQITPDDRVTVWVAKSEMGQGVRTSLPMMVAEELEADWTKVRIKPALFDKKYGNQGTGGSTSVRTSMETLRKAGASAREMLKSAAAQQWNLPVAECKAENGAVVHPSGKRATYGSLAEAAAKLPVPENPPLKDPKDFRIMGQPLHRLDTPEKVTGAAEFGMDVKRPGMLYATVARCPVFGGKPASFDAAKGKAVPGVKDVVQLGKRVGVVADSYWTALQGLRAATVVWDEGPNATLSSAEISRKFAELSKGPAQPGQTVGDAGRALASAATKLEAVYEVPYLSHATMEPMNCTAEVRADSVEIWAPTQFPQFAAQAATEITGLKPEQVTVHITLLGGGFGRRAEADFAADAVSLSKAVGAPVKVIWSREEDMQHDWYRPASHHTLAGALDAGGRLVALTHRVVCPSVGGQRGWIKEGALDEDALDCAMGLPYAIPNLRVDYVMANTAVPAGWWRSVHASQNAIATECFLDELAEAAKKDALDFRLAMLKEQPRVAAVLQLAAEKAGWGKAAAQGRARGIAFANSFGSHVAQVAEVSMQSDGTPRVHRVVCAVDCGMHVNPSIIEAQVQSAVIFGLSGLRSAITIQNGRVAQSNFHNFPIPRMKDAPEVEVHIVKNTLAPGGIGEPGLPPLGPAVLNAMAKATGKRVRTLPIRA